MTAEVGAPMRKYFMHIGNELYEEIGEGLVRVTNKHGASGIFRSDGPWVEGELREANLNMLMFCGGPTIPAIFNYRWQEVPADHERSSGWPEAHEAHLRQVGII